MRAAALLAGLVLAAGTASAGPPRQAPRACPQPTSPLASTRLDQRGWGDTMPRAVRARRVVLGLVLALPALLAGCGDTWRGFKKDTGENLEKTGRAIEKAGDKVKN